MLVALPTAAQTPATQSPDPAPVRVGPVTISGYIQADALKVFADDRDETADTFRIRRVRLALGGDIAPKIAWNLSVDMAGVTVGLRDAHMTLRLWPQFSIRIGQFYPRLGLERLTSTSRLEIIDRTSMTDRITYERNPGIAFLNLAPYKGWVTYSIGVWNGPGQNRADNNDAKDIVGRLVISPPTLPGLGFGINGASGDQPDGWRRRAGVDVLMDRPTFKVAVEALRERFEGQPDRDGYYVLAAYRIHPTTPTPHFRMLEFAARLASFRDPSAARDATPASSGVPATTDEIQFGGNYYVNRNVRLMANLIVPIDDRDAPRSTAIGRLQVIF